MPRHVSQEEWDRRAAAVRIEWLESPVGRSGKPVPARCLRCGHEWAPHAGNVTQGHGCPVCAAHARGGALALTPEEAHARMAATGVEPLEPYPGNVNAPWRCRCRRCGHEVKPRLGNVATQGACRYCRGDSISRSKRAPDPDARGLAEAWGYTPDPDTPYPGANMPWVGTCHKCGGRIAPRLGNVATQGCCSGCAAYGFDVVAPALVYVVTLDDPPRMKVGVANAETGRVERHQRRGWHVAQTWRLPNGSDALAAEAAVLRWWADVGLMPCTPEDVPNGDGFTEAVHVGSVDAPITIAFVDALLRDAGSSAD